MLRGHEGRVWKGTSDLHFHHQDTLEHLQESAALLCGICRILYQEWVKEEGRWPEERLEKPNTALQEHTNNEAFVSTSIHPGKADTTEFSSTASLSVVRGLDEHDLFRLDFHLNHGAKTRKRTFVLRQISQSPFKSSSIRSRVLITLCR